LINPLPSTFLDKRVLFLPQILHPQVVCLDAKIGKAKIFIEILDIISYVDG